MRTKQVIGTAMLFLAVMALGGCQTNTKRFVNRPPVPGWEKSIRATYMVETVEAQERGAVNTRDTQSKSFSTTKESGSKSNKDQINFKMETLEFIKRYNDRFPVAKAAEWKSKVNAKSGSKSKGVKDNQSKSKTDEIINATKAALKGKVIVGGLSDNTIAAIRLDVARYISGFSGTKAERDYLAATMTTTIIAHVQNETKGNRENEKIADITKSLKSQIDTILAGVSSASGTKASAISSDKNATDPEAKLLEMQLARNKIIGELMIVAKAYHESYDNMTRNTDVFGNIFFDFGQLAATAFASVAGSEANARSLAAFATALGGAQESVNNNYFHSQTAEAIISTMNAQRKDVEKILVANMKTMDGVDWPLEVALEEWADFLFAGTIASAVSDISGEAKEREKKTIQGLTDLQKMTKDQIEKLQKKEAQEATERAEQRALMQGLIKQHLESQGFVLPQ